jgi:hypothetical protein
MRAGLRGLGVIGIASIAIALVVLAWWATGAQTLELVRAVQSGTVATDEWTVDRLVQDLAAGLCLAAVCGFTTACGLAATSVLLRVRAPRLAGICGRVAPVTCRRLVAVCCGVGIAAPVGVAAPVWGEGEGHSPNCHSPCLSLRLGGLPLPDLPTSPRGHAKRHVRIVVRPGDSLWRIAESRLPGGASDLDVETLTRRLYALNRSTIGGDPDLIFPGMTLIAPEGKP